MQVVSEEQYKLALATMKKFENRQFKLEKVKKDISKMLLKFSVYNFKVDKKSGMIVFAGVYKNNGKVKIGVAQCSNDDVFDSDLGKLIAIRKSLCLEIDDVVKLVEQKCNWETLFRITSPNTAGNCITI